MEVAGQLLTKGSWRGEVREKKERERRGVERLMKFFVVLTFVMAIKAPTKISQSMVHILSTST